MSRSVVERLLPAACALLTVACTEPSFAPDESSSPDANEITNDAANTLDASAVLRSDASVVTTGDAGESSASKADAAPNSAQDAAAYDDAAPTAADGGAGTESGVGALVDAGVTTTPDGGAPEGGTPVTPDPVPTWAKPLLGQFAKRSIYYAYDTEGGIVTVTIDVSLLSISANAAGELSMLTQQCGYSVHWESGAASLTLVKPQSIAPTTSKLTLGQAPHFSSDTAAQAMGYDPARSSRCSPGATSAAKFPDQSWITDSSKCSCSPTAAVLPYSTDDCRVIDQDGDTRPGVAMKLDLGGSQAVVVTSTLKIGDGEVRADGEHVLHEQRTRNSACLLFCAPINDVLCPGGETLVRPLPAGATCAAALDKVNVLPVPTSPKTDCRAKNP